jgi:hypothetical protein
MEAYMPFGSAVAHQVSSIFALGDIVEPLFDRRPRADNDSSVVSVDHAAAPSQRPAKTDALHQAMSARQYLFQLNLESKELTRSEALEAVVGVNADEVRRVARVLARLRGRYLARVIDLGAVERKQLTDGEICELKRAREQYEELEQGFAALKTAIEAGDIQLDGLRAD